jgi:hypothetical protein
MAHTNEAPEGLLQRRLDAVERAGNKVPHPGRHRSTFAYRDSGFGREHRSAQENCEWSHRLIGPRAIASASRSCKRLKNGRFLVSLTRPMA